MHASRWPWLTLVACAAASGSAGAQVSAPSDAGFLPPTTPVSSPPASADSETPKHDGSMPPMRVVGSLSYDVHVSRTTGEPSLAQQLVSGTLGTRTYVYEPWFATVSGSLGLT